MKRPISWAGFAIMAMAVVVGFVPTIWSILALFATTLLGGHMIKKHAEESYKGFLRMFGYMVAILNIIAAGLIMMTPLDYIDKASAAFLNILVAIIALTLLLNERKSTDRDEQQD